MAKAAGKTYGVSAFIVTHGESDAGNADYENQLRLLQQSASENEEKLKTARQKEFEFLKKEQEIKNREQELEIVLQKKLLAERNVLVLGDAMADWLAYGLEDAYAEQPDIGVIRRHKTVSGLIRYQPKGEPADWAAAAKGILASEKPDAIEHPTPEFSRSSPQFDAREPATLWAE